MTISIDSILVTVIVVLSAAYLARKGIVHVRRLMISNKEGHSQRDTISKKPGGSCGSGGCCH